MLRIFVELAAYAEQFTHFKLCTSCFSSCKCLSEEAYGESACVSPPSATN